MDSEQEDRVHTVIPPEAILGYTTGGAVLTLVLPLGFFIVVMAAFYLIFSRPHTVPGHRDRVEARPEAPHPAVAHPIAAATEEAVEDAVDSASEHGPAAPESPAPSENTAPSDTAPSENTGDSE
jgi:hypothetical protein